MFLVKQMMPVKEQEEKVVLSEEDQEMELDDEEKEEEEEEEEAAEAEESGENVSTSEEDDVYDDNGDKSADDSPQTLDETKTDSSVPAQPEEKKPPGSLNVNNEVVKMRKEVKRVRALIIRKLTRQIGKLKKKKGKEADVERNQRRAGRLLEEIHAMKALSPDKVESDSLFPQNVLIDLIADFFFLNSFCYQVTKTALQKNLNFEQECKNPKSTAADRAIARIATHPQFNKKIQDIKAAVVVFKEDRKKGGKEREKTKAGKVAAQLEKKKDKSEDQKDAAVEKQKPLEVKGGETVFQNTVDVDLTEPKTVTQPAEKTVSNKTPQTRTVKVGVVKNTAVKDVKNTLKMTEKPKVASEEESDLDPSDDEEKEYFDDSTEERFHKQSSHSEESEEDDFFVGKVSKFKKKKQKDLETIKANGDQTEEDQSRREKVTSLDSIFCSSLARSKPGRGRGAGRGRTGDGGRGRQGRGESRGRDGPREAFSKPSKFQEKLSHGDRGRGRGRGGVARKNDHKDGSAFSAEPALHPSWEASKKRKEQQGQILAFQGKKIKFDDDD